MRWAYQLITNTLKLSTVRIAWKSDHIPNVRHACNKQHQALKAQAKAGVRASTIAPRV